MRVLLTGGTGFLGGFLISELTRMGIETRVFARATSDVSALEVDVVRGSFDDPGSLVRALRGVDVVLHAAGGGLGSAEAIYRSNTESTRALLAASKGTSLRRFVLVSSLAAAGPSRAHSPLSEVDPARPMSDYGKSKLAAERAVIAAGDRLHVTVVRPPAIYGPGDTRMLPLFRGAQRGVVPLVAPQGTLSIVYAEDVARAIGRAVAGEHESGRVYFLSAEIITRRELAESIGHAVSRRVRVASLPKTLLRALGVAGSVARAMGRTSLPLTVDKARDVTQEHQSCSAERIRAELGWVAEVPLEEGMKRTASDYRSRGWLLS